MIPHQDKSPASPCINVCQMDPRTGLCRGCWRTLDEIAGWSRATADGKWAMLSAVSQRRAGHDPSSEQFRGDYDR